MQVNAIGCCYGCASIDFIRYNTWTHILILSEFAETPNTGRLDILGWFYSKYTYLLMKQGFSKIVNDDDKMMN